MKFKTVENKGGIKMANSRVFINLSNHNLTKEQDLEVLSVGATQVEVPEEIKKEWGSITPMRIGAIVDKFMKFYHNVRKDMSEDGTGYKYIIVHIAGQSGAVYSILNALALYGLTDEVKVYPVYSFTERESVEEVQVDGSVIKKSVFKHKGFFMYYGTKDSENYEDIRDGQTFDVSCNSLMDLLSE